MSPTLPDILRGIAAALTAPAPPEASGEYAMARVGMIGMLCALAAQEAERGPGARLWENREMRLLFGRAAGEYDQDLSGRLSQAAAADDGDGAWSALDLANAGLRRVLISLHEATEKRGDTALNREILELYRQMAHHRRLELPDLAGR